MTKNTTNKHCERIIGSGNLEGRILISDFVYANLDLLDPFESRFSRGTFSD